MPRDLSIDNKVVQWEDLSGQGRRIVSNNVRAAGLNLTFSVSHQIDRLKVRAASGKSAESRKKAGIDLHGLQSVQPHLVDQPVTLRSAAKARQGFYNNAIQAKSEEGDEHNVIPEGTGWYYKHHADIKASAERFGFDPHTAIAASGVMSPLNSPSQEKQAVHAMMDTFANHKVKITPAVVQHLAKNKIDVSEHAGKTVHFDQLPPGSLAHLSTGSFASQVETTAPLDIVRKGGTKTNVIKAENLLMGRADPDTPVDPHSAPKVASYIRNTQRAVPGSPEHQEYVGRVAHDALVRRGHISREQGQLDVHGLAGSSQGLLSPHSGTVEDTWQNSATFNQPKVNVGKSSVFKSGGSLDTTYPVAGVKTNRVTDEMKKSGYRTETAHPDARVGKAALTHAFNNKATRIAADQQSRGSGVTVPPVAMQEVGWTQMRKEAGKDAAHNAEARKAPEPTEVPGQQALWGKPVSGHREIAHHEDDPGYGASGEEASRRAAAVIGTNSRRKRDRAIRAAGGAPPLSRPAGSQAIGGVGW
jgi:hypothetical protein